MKYLFDTHYLLWTLFEPDKIKDKIKKIFANEKAIKYFSGISMWEISLKYSLDKLELLGTNPDEIFDKIKESGFTQLDIETEELAFYYKLPKKENHKDPFDRMIIWQAIHKKLILISEDNCFEQYIENGLKIEAGT